MEGDSGVIRDFADPLGYSRHTFQLPISKPCRARNVFHFQQILMILLPHTPLLLEPQTRDRPRDHRDPSRHFILQHESESPCISSILASDLFPAFLEMHANMTALLSDACRHDSISGDVMY